MAQNNGIAGSQNRSQITNSQSFTSKYNSKVEVYRFLAQEVSNDLNNLFIIWDNRLEYIYQVTKLSRFGIWGI